MLSIVIENVRSLVGRHAIPIAPLTILVGENSTGKSSFLATLNAISQAGFPFAPAFNRAPYQLGNFDTIATYKGGKYGRAKTFSIGYSDDRPRSGVAANAIATYRGRNGQPELSEFVASGSAGEIGLSMLPTTERQYRGTVRLKLEGIDVSLPFSVPRVQGLGRSISIPDVIFGAQLEAGGDRLGRNLDVVRRVMDFAHSFSPIQSESIAPIRTRPERTYGEVIEEHNPSGDQVPFVLERFDREAESKDAARVTQALNSFGAESGLFGSLRVRKLGAKAGEPFQLMVNIDGKDRNLVDVGYGVSQALPVIVQSALVPTNQLLLVQQPEVHLHPRAQAALGSFFVNLVQSAKKRVVIESHSDYIIDRIRQEIAAGRIPAKSVALLFFHREKMETAIYEVRLDDRGDVVDAPACYREFFLQEELNLLRR